LNGGIESSRHANPREYLFGTRSHREIASNSAVLRLGDSSAPLAWREASGFLAVFMHSPALEYSSVELMPH
jgi:hypothetical protein